MLLPLTVIESGRNSKEYVWMELKAAKVAREAAPRPPHHAERLVSGDRKEGVSRRSRSPRFMQPVLLRSE